MSNEPKIVPPIIQPGIYVLEETVKNPKKDGRKKGWQYADFQPGKYEVSTQIQRFDSVGVTLYTAYFKPCGTNGVGEWLNPDLSSTQELVEKFKEETGDSIERLYADCPDLDLMSKDVLAVLLEEGKLTFADIRKAYATATDRFDSEQ